MAQPQKLFSGETLKYHEQHVAPVENSAPTTKIAKHYSYEPFLVPKPGTKDQRLWLELILVTSRSAQIFTLQL